MKNLLHKLKNAGDPLIFIIFTLSITIIYSCLYNLQLFRNQYPAEYFTILVLMSFGRDMIIWYIAGLNKWVFAVFTPIMFGFGAGLDYFIRTIKMTIGIGSFELLFQTNLKEAVGVINFDLMTDIILGLVISTIFILIRFYIGGVKGWKMKGILLVLFVLPLIFGKLPEKELKEVKYGKGGNTERGYTAMPEKILENLYHYALNQYRINKLYNDRKNSTPPEVTYKGEPQTIVFILTDALRPDHMSLNGYNRDTTPNMIKEGMISFADMYACETSTTRSVPCLMTRASRTQPLIQYIKEPSILSMFKNAGFHTAWLSSQGSISTADTGPSVVASDADIIYFNNNSNSLKEPIYDNHLLPKLDEFLKDNNQNKAVVLHLNGSHWDYHTRYTPEQLKWTPECKEWVYDCSIESVINAYDNSIIATDELVRDVIAKLKDKKAAIFFSSDHGQFLGEHGRRIHSHELLDFKEVTVVPFVVWLSDSMKNDPKFKHLDKNKSKITSHDSLFHSITHCAGLESPLIQDNLSICSENLIDLPKEF